MTSTLENYGMVFRGTKCHEGPFWEKEGKLDKEQLNYIREELWNTRQPNTRGLKAISIITHIGKIQDTLCSERQKSDHERLFKVGGSKKGNFQREAHMIHRSTK